MDMDKNFIKVVSNPALFSPTVYLVPEIIRIIVPLDDQYSFDFGSDRSFNLVKETGFVYHAKADTALKKLLF